MLKLCLATLYATLVLSVVALVARSEDSVFDRGVNVVDDRLAELLEKQSEAKKALAEATATHSVTKKLKDACDYFLKEAEATVKVWQAQKADLSNVNIDAAEKLIADLEAAIEAAKTALADAKKAATKANAYEEPDVQKKAEALKVLRDKLCEVKDAPELARKKQAEVRLALSKGFADELLRRGNSNIETLLDETIDAAKEAVEKRKKDLMGTPRQAAIPLIADAVEAKPGLNKVLTDAVAALDKATKKYEAATNAVERYVRTKAETMNASKLDAIATATQANAKAVEDLGGKVDGLTATVKTGFEKSNEQLTLLVTQVKGLKEETAKAALAFAKIPLSKEESDIRNSLLNKIVELLEKKQLSEEKADEILKKATQAAEKAAEEALKKQQAAAVPQAPPAQQPQQYVGYYQQQPNCNGRFCNRTR